MSSGSFNSQRLRAALLSVVILAGALALAEGLQLWDALICTVSARQGAALLLTEDMQDGRTYAGVRLVNPFAGANVAFIDLQLPPS
jgi:predicted nucleic acid-binding protein